MKLPAFGKHIVTWKMRRGRAHKFHFASPQAPGKLDVEAMRLEEFARNR